MKIALCHFRVGENDGVSLEMDKWKRVLEGMGHEVVFIAGSSNEVKDSLIIPELHYLSDYNEEVLASAYSGSEAMSAYDLQAKIEHYASRIEDQLTTIINEAKINLIVPNNILSLGWNLSAGLAFSRAIRATGIACICHHHDWYFERDLYSEPSCDYVKNLLDEHFPPRDAKVKHVVINSIAQGVLQEMKGVPSSVVPNVFDFGEAISVHDDFNQDFRSQLGLKDSDIVFLQATRVVERKAIELVIEVIAEIQNQSDLIEQIRQRNQSAELVLLLVGMADGREVYLERLQEFAAQQGVKLLFVGEHFDYARSADGETKIFNLWDAYLYADVVSYPSVLEGWGNQFLEAVVAKLPVIQFDYPVFLADIKNKGFETISLGATYRETDSELLTLPPAERQRAAAEMVSVLVDPLRCRSMTEKNYLIAEQYFSLKSLAELLEQQLEALFSQSESTPHV